MEWLLNSQIIFNTHYNIINKSYSVGLLQAGQLFKVKVYFTGFMEHRGTVLVSVGGLGHGCRLVAWAMCWCGSTGV